MLIKCPACGASASLDTLIDDEPAAQALMSVLKITPVGRLLVKYLGLFRPEKRQLSWSKVAKLLQEITPMIEQQRIKRDGVEYTVPLVIFEKAIATVLDAREAGKLTLPMKSHGYLLEVIISELAKAEKDQQHAAVAQKERERKDNERKVEQTRREVERRAEEQPKPRDNAPMPENVKQLWREMLSKPTLPPLTPEQKEQRKKELLEQARRLQQANAQTV